MMNPLVLLISNGLGVNKCKGCGKSITRQELQYPNNMVFCQGGPSGFYNLKTDKYIEKEGNIHFHVNIKCLQEKRIAIEEQHTILYDDTLC